MATKRHARRTASCLAVAELQLLQGIRYTVFKIYDFSSKKNKRAFFPCVKSYDVSDCVNYFICFVSNSIYKRKTNFLAKLKCSANVLIGLFLDVISTELSSL